MKLRMPRISMKWVWIIGIVVAGTVGGATWSRWSPIALSWVDRTIASFRGGEKNDEAAATKKDKPVRNESSLQLSPQAMRNIGLSNEMIKPIELETFRRSITVPAMVVERPGRTRIQVAAPMTGVVTRVHIVEGEAVEPGDLLFEIRLTHEDLVTVQTEFVKTLGELDVEKKEIERLTKVTQSGAVAGKVLLEREYARDKLAALLNAQRESLRLHGLTRDQIKSVEKSRRLLGELKVYASALYEVAKDADVEGENKPDEKDADDNDNVLILQKLNVHQGQSIRAGESLCVLANYAELFIEGMAFEQDLVPIRQALQRGWTVEARFQRSGPKPQIAKGLKITYLANSVGAESRTLRFYVRLSNKLSKDRRDRGDPYVEWTYLPGQRLQLRVPIEEWPEQIVLPVDAVANEGAESYVFQQNGDHFDRVAVHVTYRDQYSVVVANDGSLFQGDRVALRGAHQMQMALKNKSGGAIDPHAGHNH